MNTLPDCFDQPDKSPISMVSGGSPVLTTTEKSVWSKRMFIVCNMGSAPAEHQWSQAPQRASAPTVAPPRQTCQADRCCGWAIKTPICHGNLGLGSINPVGALFFSGPRADARWMPRYFFRPGDPDRIIGDPRGTVLPSDEVAVGTARTIIDELLEDSGPGQPRPIIMVRNGAGEIVYQFPSN